MTERRRAHISPEKKKQILKEILHNDSDIKLLATKYQLATKTLSKWRSDYYKGEKQEGFVGPEQAFVEVKVGKEIKECRLKKVELIFDNHRCIIDGRLSNEQLIKLLQVLEEASC